MSVLGEIICALNGCDVLSYIVLHLLTLLLSKDGLHVRIEKAQSGTRNYGRVNFFYSIRKFGLVGMSGDNLLECILRYFVSCVLDRHST